MTSRKLSEEIKRRIHAGETSFEGENLPGLDLSGMHSLENMNFKLCNLAGANFRGSTLRGSDFRGADLASVTFEDADLERCRFLGPELGQTNCRGAEIEGVLIENRVLD